MRSKCLNKKFHLGHIKFEGLGDIQKMHSGRQLHMWARWFDGGVPGPAERGLAGGDQMPWGESWLTAY